MSRRLPPLNALRAFEAAARHLSFLKAAEELSVTPGAVSQQVKTLEEQIGIPLFRRLARGVLLTDAGQRYAKRISELLDGIADATQSLCRDDGPAVLTVSTMPSLAARWLIPRLSSFNQYHPDITVRVLAESELTDFSRDDVDVAIRFGAGRYNGLAAHFLFKEERFPVCSPQLLTTGRPLRHPADLAHYTLLHDEPSDGLHDLSWQIWLDAHHATKVDTRPGPRFTLTLMSLQAAVAGQGVALGTNVLAEDDLETGRLIRPFPESVTSEHSYWLVYPVAAAERAKIVAFTQWLTRQAQDFLARQARFAFAT